MHTHTSWFSECRVSDSDISQMISNTRLCSIASHRVISMSSQLKHESTVSMKNSFSRDVDFRALSKSSSRYRLRRFERVRFNWWQRRKDQIQVITLVVVYYVLYYVLVAVTHQRAGESSVACLALSLEQLSLETATGVTTSTCYLCWNVRSVCAPLRSCRSALSRWNLRISEFRKNIFIFSRNDTKNRINIEIFITRSA